MRLSDTLPDFTGALLDDERLEVLECLGSGAYGRVYKAVDRTSRPESPSYFAVKCLLKPRAGTREEEFQLREMALQKKVSGHPNILAIHEVLYDDFFVYVILDFCDGGDLFAAITETGTFDSANESVRDVFVQLLDAVQHCHDLGVYHRDLKPENVLCSKDGTFVRIGDFGLSTDRRVCEDFGCGSSYYMSPECLGKDYQRSHYSARQNDIWSLGVILINLITSRNPWSLAVSTDQHFRSF
ncbi:Pkinase-domain-containing protein, partial [Marasmius fiardii PR-910]